MILTIFGIIAIGLLAIYGISKLLIRHNAKSVYNVLPKELSNYSWPARQILKEYNTLPAGNRPYSNLSYMLKSLDIKYGVRAVNDHFSEKTRNNDVAWGWDLCDRYNRTCRHHPEYKKMFDAIKDVKYELAEQKRRFEIAGVSDGLSQVEDFMSELGREKELIKEITAKVMK